MPTVTNLQRSRPSTHFFIERDGLRGGPFRGVLDSDRILESEHGGRGRLTLRRGMIDDPFLRAWILRRRRRTSDPDAANTGDEYLDLSAVHPNGELLARWNLNRVRILEVCDRRRRRDDDPNFDYIILEALARHDHRR